ncbi:hypothetical protein GCM10027180_35900 [Microbulbifer echini]
MIFNIRIGQEQPYKPQQLPLGRPDTQNVVVKPIQPYTTTRLLVGTFLLAVECLKGGLKEIGATGLFKPKPILHLEAKEMSEGGLSEVEQRCLGEMAYAAGARKVEFL